MQGENETIEELQSLVAPNRELNLELKKKIGSLESDFIGLFIIHPEKFNDANLELLKIMRHEQKLSGVYITGNKPYETLQKHFSENSVDTSEIVFIDCVSEMANASIKSQKNCFYIESPEQLTSLEIALEHAVEESQAKRLFVVLDSVSTLLIYHKSEVVEKFIHLLTTKIRKRQGMQGVLVAVESAENTSLLKSISQFCDRTIRIG
jgi:KaiC/GvpD/RAD55 family RecA-like ATPase